MQTTDGKEATCWPHAGESRKFHSTFGIGAGSPLGRCGLAFRGLHSDLPDYTLQSTSSTTSTEPPAGSCDCGIAEWDWRCHDPSTDPLGGLGCMGCGVQECRLEDLFVFFPHTFTHCATFSYDFFAYAGFAVQTPTHRALGPATMVRRQPVSPTRRRPRLRQRRALKSHLVTALPAKVLSGAPRASR